MFAKKIPKNSNHDDSGISLSAFAPRNNLSLHNIHVIPKLVKKAINNFYGSKPSGPDCVQTVEGSHLRSY